MDPLVYRSPLIGASGAIFGILFAYGIIFSERIIYFLMLFPMKAIHFTLIVAGIELVSLIKSGVGSPVSHLGHLSGFAVGFLFLEFWKWFQNHNLRRLRRTGRRFLKILDKDED